MEENKSNLNKEGLILEKNSLESTENNRSGIKLKEEVDKRIDEDEEVVKPKESHEEEVDLSGITLKKEKESVETAIVLKRPMEIEKTIKEIERLEEEVEQLRAYQFKYEDLKEEVQIEVGLLKREIESEKEERVKKIKILSEKKQELNEELEKEIVKRKKIEAREHRVINEMLESERKLRNRLDESISKEDYESVKQENIELANQIETIEEKFNLKFSDLSIRSRQIEEVYKNVDREFSEIMKKYNIEIEKEKENMNKIMTNIMQIKRFLGGVEPNYNYKNGIKEVINGLESLNNKIFSNRIKNAIEKLKEM